MGIDSEVKAFRIVEYDRPDITSSSVVARPDNYAADAIHSAHS
jgi:hypothetical protein